MLFVLGKLSIQLFVWSCISLQDAERLPKRSKDRYRDAFLKDGSASVFRDGFHAQLRETHGANMRAVEAAEEDEKDHRWRRRNLDPDMVNNLMEDVIRQIADEGELVTEKKVRRKKNLFKIIF